MVKKILNKSVFLSPFHPSVCLTLRYAYFYVFMHMSLLSVYSMTLSWKDMWDSCESVCVCRVCVWCVCTGELSFGNFARGKPLSLIWCVWWGWGGGMSGHGGGSIEQTSHRNQQDCRLFELHIFIMNLMSFCPVTVCVACLELVHLPLYFLFYYVDLIQINPWTQNCITLSCNMLLTKKNWRP